MPIGRSFAGPGRTWQRAALLAGAAVLACLVLPSGVGSAAPGRPAPTLKSLLARAQQLANQVNSLNEQANGLRIQLDQARTEVKVAQHTYSRDLAELAGGRLAIGRLAAQSYMNGGLDTILQLLTTSSPQTLIDRAAIITELQQENGQQVSLIEAGVAAARRAQQTSRQQAKRAVQLAGEIAAKQRAAQAKIRVLNSAVFQRALAIFNQTGQYPNIHIPTANTIGAQALRYALSQQGKPYVWGAAGPSAYDCSGLVMWAYAQVGISLPHFTGAQWNTGVHVSRNNLQPGDLVFFYPDISHVGLYIGNGLMVDAPDFGETVRVQPVLWAYFVGAVRIVG